METWYSLDDLPVAMDNLDRIEDETNRKRVRELRACLDNDEVEG